MYKIKNVSLDRVYEKYNIKDLSELTDDQLVELCTTNKDFNTQPKYFIEKKMDDRITRGGFDRYRTIDAIIDAHSFSDYMGNTYWEQRHIKEAERRKISDILKRNTSGEETFQVFADMGIGFYKLKPGDEVDLDVTSAWIRDRLGIGDNKDKTKSPYKGKLKIVGESSEADTIAEVNKPRPELGVSEDKAKILEKMTYPELKKMAKKKDLKLTSPTKKQLVEAIAKV